MSKNIKWSIIIAIALIFIITGSVAAYYSGGSKDLSEKGTTPKNTTNGGSAAQGTTDVKTDDKSQVVVPIKDPVKVRALYLTGWTVGIDSKLQHYVELAKTTEINSYVVDIKDDDGLVGYQSDIPAVVANKAYEKKYNVDKVIKAFHDNGIHVVGRIVCFKDPVLSSKRPDLAIKNVNGGVWRDKKGMSWLDPYNQENWTYLTDIAKEAVKKGFDEIQFDYVRFANDGDKKAMKFNDNGVPKYEDIANFLAYARKELPGVTISADIFGIVCESPADTEGIGQYLEYVGKNIDYISPMAYPSHYAVGQIVNKVTFVKPDLDPYGVVYNTLLKAKERISKVPDYTAKIRPYLQDFTASWLGKGYYQSYGDEQVKEQIKAVTDAGYDQWILWDANNTYSESALAK